MKWFWQYSRPIVFVFGVFTIPEQPFLGHAHVHNSLTTPGVFQQKEWFTHRQFDRCVRWTIWPAAKIHDRVFAINAIRKFSASTVIVFRIFVVPFDPAFTETCRVGNKKLQLFKFSLPPFDEYFWTGVACVACIIWLHRCTLVITKARVDDHSMTCVALRGRVHYLPRSNSKTWMCFYREGAAQSRFWDVWNSIEVFIPKKGMEECFRICFYHKK